MGVIKSHRTRAVDGGETRLLLGLAEGERTSVVEPVRVEASAGSGTTSGAGAELLRGERTAMGIEHAEFRRVMGHLATGVVVVATRDPENGAPCGLTANAVASVSLEPTLVLVCIDKEATSHQPLLDAGIFSINVLSQMQERIARRFAEWEAARKFEGIAYRQEASGAPVLEDSLAWLDCRVWSTYPGGDHTIVVGEVLMGDAREGDPLVYYRGGYGRFKP